MIFDTLDNYPRYARLPHHLPAALNFLQATNLAALPVGRIDIDGDRLYAIVQEYTTKPISQASWEAHRTYIDVQYMVWGSERMGFANLRTMQIGEYVPEKDYQALTGAGNFVDVFPGSFAIFFPEDAHMPGLSIDASLTVRKIVLKAKMEEKCT